MERELMSVKRINPRKWVLPAVAAAMGCADMARAEYAVLDLGAMTSVGGVNATGQVALTAPSGMTSHAFVYSGGTLLDLGTLGGTDSSSSAINGAGLVVGKSTTAAGVTHPFVWTPGGTGGVASNPRMTDLNPNGAASEASAINSTGQVVGYVSSGNGNGDSAVIYSNGGVTPIPLPAGGYTFSYAYGINDAGKVVGAGYIGQSSSAHGFCYDGTKSVAIGDLGGMNTSPSAINNNDRIVGYSTTAGGFDHAFVSVNGTMTDLGTLGAGHYSYANAINNINQIVGGSFIDAADATFHAFISDGATMTDLNSLVTSKAASWVLSEANGINDNGVIVGTGTLSDQPHAFMLKPLLPGDANADLKVDFADLLTLAQHYNLTGATWEQGDFNGDGTVGFADLLALAQNYGRQSDPSPAFTAVPEPGASVSLVAAARRRRRSASRS